MNSAANLRASIIRSSMVPVPPVSRVATGYDIEAPTPSSTTSRLGRRPGDIDVSDNVRQRVLKELNYLEYRAMCQLQRDRRTKGEVAEEGDTSSVFTAKQPVVEVESSAVSKLGRMFTIFPYRDMNWVVAVMFVLGSISFVVNAALGLLPVVAPQAVFPTLVGVALPATVSVGAVLFLAGGVLGVFAGFNADRGTVQMAAPGKTVEGDRTGPDVYRPALVGSSSWVWIPNAAEAAAVVRTVPFQTGLMQLSGGLILTTASVAGFPGVLDPVNQAFLFSVLVFLPLVIGGAMFFIANVILTIYWQEKWYKPNFFSADWQGGFWNAVGSSGFLITGVLLLMGDLVGSAWTNLYGSATFLLGSVIQWYSLMEFHPTRWAG